MSYKWCSLFNMWCVDELKGILKEELEAILN